MTVAYIHSCSVVTSQTVTECMPPERAAYKKLTKTLKNHSSWLDYLNLPKFFAVIIGF